MTLRDENLQPITSTNPLSVFDRMPGLTMTQTATSASTGATTALAANAARLYAWFQNESSNTVWLKWGSGATTQSGVRLSSSGGSFEMSAKLGNLYTGLVSMIASSTSGNPVTVIEGTS